MLRNIVTYSKRRLLNVSHLKLLHAKLSHLKLLHDIVERLDGIP